MKNINTILLVLLILIGGLIIYGLYFFNNSVTDKHVTGSKDTIQVSNFEACVSAGNPVMESYPRQCRHEGITYSEEIPEDPVSEAVICPEEARGADFCIEIYKPVCGKVNVVCITEPCNPVYETFSNFCFACINSLVESYTEGECS